MPSFTVGSRAFSSTIAIFIALHAFPALAECNPLSDHAMHEHEPSDSSEHQSAPSRSTVGAVAHGRNIRASDLLGLRDIGSPDRPEEDPIFALSPDGKRMAFFVTRSDTATNTICRALLTMAASPGARPQILDVGGAALFEDVAIRGLQTVYGYRAVDVPKWSPDGKWLAYLRREDGSTQLWRVRANGTGAEPLTRIRGDVETFSWSRDGHSLHFGAQQKLRQAMRDRELEGLSGFHFDDRYAPYNDDRPAIVLPLPLDYFTLDLGELRLSPARQEDTVDLKVPKPGESPGATAQSVAGYNSVRFETRSREPGNVLASSDLWLLYADGKEIRCPAAICASSEFSPLIQVWWSEEHRSAFFLHRTGWGKSQTGLYRWEPGSGAVKEIMHTDDTLSGCQLVAGALICGRDSSSLPRRLVRIDAINGSSTLIWDPNPEFSRLSLGTVQRLHWRNSLGFENYGDLVLPPGFNGAMRLPLVVVQYSTRGFLRGGTGDEYPIWLFARRGFAVLSIQKTPPYFLTIPGIAPKDWPSAHALNTLDFRDEKNALSNVEHGVQRVIDMGIADPTRIGITGLSAGATTVMYGLLHSSLFAAAALSSMGNDAQSLTYGGPRLIDFRVGIGYPAPGTDDTAFWRQISLAANADAVRTPLLMQLASHEYILGLETWAALRAKRRPVDMFVFPDEGHLKWQPAHRAAIYERNLDWFDFWLNAKIDQSRSKERQYAAWRRLRDDTAQALNPAG